MSDKIVKMGAYRKNRRPADRTEDSELMDLPDIYDPVLEE